MIINNNEVESASLRSAGDFRDTPCPIRVTGMDMDVAYYFKIEIAQITPPLLLEQL
jgi:hypothetical protein